MDTLKQALRSFLERSKHSGALLVLYALGTEALCIAYIFLAGLFTLEALLPTFVTTRLSLSAFFTILLVCTFVIALLGRYLETSFPWTFTWKSPLVLLGMFWATGILALSLLKFPWVTLPLFLIGFLVSGYLFWQVLFEEEK